jgi:hypothetical protein
MIEVLEREKKKHIDAQRHTAEQLAIETKKREDAERLLAEEQKRNAALTQALAGRTLVEGARVRHATLGDGVVIKLLTGLDPMVQVKFESGTKWFALSEGNLRVL